jgi:hypothetical protein
MSFVIKESGGSKLPLIPEGIHQGICVGIFDLGTQYDKKWDKKAKKCVFIWELPEHRIEIEKDGVKKDLPRVCSKKYTASLHLKSKLRQDLQSWRGKAFTDDELSGFDIKKVLGVNCMIQFIHDGEYANIESILPLYKGMTPLVPETDFMYFHMSEGLDLPDNTPKWIKETIEGSEEFKGLDETGVRPAGTNQEQDVPF